MPTGPTVARARDILVELAVAELTVGERRALVEELSSYVRQNESRDALREVLDRVADGLSASSDLAAEMSRWRPTVERAMLAHATLAEAEAKRILTAGDLRVGLVGWLRDVANARFVLTLLLIVAAALGVRVSIPTSPAAPPVVVTP